MAGLSRLQHNTSGQFEVGAHECLPTLPLEKSSELSLVKPAVAKKQQSLLLQELAFKRWFQTRYKPQVFSQYHSTASQVRSDAVIDDMFSKLDEDGGGTLDCQEINALFQRNGIHMGVDAVANMFGEAQRRDSYQSYRQKMQDGMYS